MKEQALAFGPGDGLVGVLSLPGVPLPPDTPLPGILFWNAGLLHRIGPARLYVTLARSLAAHGMPCLRFDLPGRGDSAAPVGAESDREQAVRAIRAAMDLLAAHAGVRRFVLVGLCSGADQAHAAAAADPRVAGFVAMDGYAYPTSGFWMRRVWNCVSNPHRLAGLVRRVCAGQRIVPAGPSEAPEAVRSEIGNFDFQFPPRDQVQRELEAMQARGVQALFIYSGESGETFNHAGQFRRMFKGTVPGPTVACVYLADTDHLFALPGNGEQVVKLITTWVTDLR